MNPSPELDKLVCEIVGIRPRGSRDCGHWDNIPNATSADCLTMNTADCGVPVWRPCIVDLFPPVSTSLGECEPVLEWLRKQDNSIHIQHTAGGWQLWCQKWQPCGQTIQHAACLAVLAINEERKSNG